MEEEEWKVSCEFELFHIMVGAPNLIFTGPPVSFELFHSLVGAPNWLRHRESSFDPFLAQAAANSPTNSFVDASYTGWTMSIWKM